MICLKWFIASIAITFVVRIQNQYVYYALTDVSQIGTPFGGAGEVRNEGKYDAFPYKYIGYPKVARNMFEMDTPQDHRTAEIGTNPVAERVLRPRFLCFLQAEGRPAMILNVEEWITQHGSEEGLSYVFVAYTAEQFHTDEDYMALHQIAEAAARTAGVVAYWIGCSCMPEPDNLQDDVSLVQLSALHVIRLTQVGVPNL
jgi:hypothetical protein